MERVSIGDLSFQTILIDWSKPRVVVVVLETEVVQFNRVGVAVVWSSRDSAGKS